VRILLLAADGKVEDEGDNKKETGQYSDNRIFFPEEASSLEYRYPFFCGKHHDGVQYIMISMHFSLSSIGETVLRRLRIARISPYVPARATLLDVGCGRGKLLFDLAPRLVRGYGVDQRVEARTVQNVTLQPWVFPAALPFVESSFEVVTMTAVLEHVTDADWLLRECHRVLRPGGTLVVTTPSPRAKPILEFLAFKLHLISAQEIADHKHYFSSQELREALSRAGYSQIAVSPFQWGCNLFSTAQK
jgi:2-polyprenyl-3-methyl-5-hydroxy-6-metoxy-1,4-benzoquinol methylase